MARKPTHEELEQRVKELGIESAERKRIEQSLQLTQFAIDHFSDAAFWMGPDARFVYVNEAACRALGYSREELLTMTVHDIDPDFPEEVWPEHWAEVRRRGSFVLQSHHRTKDGRIFSVEISVNYVNFGGKELNCAFARDITERKQAEEATRASEERYRAVLEACPDPVVVYDMEGKCSYINTAFTTVFGWTPEELIGKRLDYVPEENWPETQLIIDRVLAGESFSGVESRRYTKDGDILDVSISAAIHLSRDGIPVGSVHFLRDITERKQAEEALLESTRRMQLAYDQAIAYAKELNKEIDERKRAEEALQRRKEQLKAKAQSLEEVNTALKVLLKQREEDKTELEEKVLSNVKQLVLPYIETLRKSRLGDEQMAYVSIIESNLTDIVSPFLRKLSSKYLRLTPKEIQIADLVKIGKTTKEIADLLNVSTRAIEFHRENIRTKLGLKNQPINLRTQLLSFE